jgi:hypothetical protein
MTIFLRVKFQDFLVANYLHKQLDGNYKTASLLSQIERATQVVMQNGTRVASCDGLGVIEIDERLSE